MNILYLESIAGIAGDMFAASFLDAGLVTRDELQALCDKLGIPEVKIEVSEVMRSKMRATHIDVNFDALNWQQRFPILHHHDNHDSHTHSTADFHVHYRELEKIIIQSALSEPTKKMACQIFDVLAEAEAHCHGVKKEDVVFHELGMVDSLMDIVMAAYCITKIEPQLVIASPVKLGRGLIKTAHGTLPVPPPVSAALAVMMETTPIPSVIENEHIELSTPTGLAILKSLQPVFSTEWPAGKIISQGYGAGTMELDNYPNLFRICLVDTQIKTDVNELPYLSDKVMEIKANYDDVSPEYLAWTTEKLFALGARDVWQTTAVGKKGRVMIILSILVSSSDWTKYADFILKNTPTFGLRYQCLDRLTLERHFETRVTDQGSFQVKVGSNTHGKKLKEKFEFDDIRQSWDNDTLIE